MGPAYLLKKDLDMEGLAEDEKGEKEEEAAASAAAWRGCLTLKELLLCLVLVSYCVALILFAANSSYLSPLYSSSSGGRGGSETSAFVWLSAVMLLVLLLSMAIVSFRNVSAPRLHTLIHSTQTIVFALNVAGHIVVGMTLPSTQAPWSSRLAVLFSSSVVMFWVFADTLKTVSRCARAIITLTAVFSVAMAIVLTLFVWPDRNVADPNGPEVTGAVMRKLILECAASLLPLLLILLRQSCS